MENVVEVQNLRGMMENFLVKYFIFVMGISALSWQTVEH